MAEKKAIVIKVKYPVSATKAGMVSSPQVITEWNIKRISAAVAGVMLLIGCALYIVNHKDSQIQLATSPINSKLASPEVDQKVRSQSLVIEPSQSVVNSKANQAVVIPKASQESKPNKAKQAGTKTIAKSKPIEPRKNQEHPKNVVRALVTKQVNNKEPGHEISRQVIINKQPIWLYYFTELRNMSGQKVYHEWLKNNVLVSRHELNIEANNWRTSSRKLFSDNAKGHWTVKLLDESGHILNEKKFKAN